MLLKVTLFPRVDISSFSLPLPFIAELPILKALSLANNYWVKYIKDFTIQLTTGSPLAKNKAFQMKNQTFKSYGNLKLSECTEILMNMYFLRNHEDAFFGAC